MISLLKRSAPVVVIGAALAVGAVACGSKEAQGLPPPTGSGAPPPATIPKLSEMNSPAAAAAAGSTQAAWTGTLVARREAQLGPKMTGILSEITVEEGVRVKKGQLLFRLDAPQTALGVSQAKAALASAQVVHDSAKLELSRASELMKNNSIAPASYDQAKSGFDRAAAGIEQAKVAVQMAERAAADTAVYSPIDGIVTAKLKNQGETVTMMPPTVVLVVQDVEHLELRAHLPEQALASLEQGKSLRMSVPTVGVTRDVPIKRINPTLDPRTRTVEVVADVDNMDGKLKVGMLVEVAHAEAAGAGSAAAPDPRRAAGGPSEAAKAP